MQNNMTGILSIKKSWFKQFKPLKFTLKDIDENYIEIQFDEYEELRYKAQQAEKSILEYLSENQIKTFTRKDIEQELKNEHSITSIKKALSTMIDKSIIVAEGTTKDRLYKVL